MVGIEINNGICRFLNYFWVSFIDILLCMDEIKLSASLRDFIEGEHNNMMTRRVSLVGMGGCDFQSVSLKKKQPKNNVSGIRRRISI